MRRILVIGTTGSGKTTLAKQIAQKCGHTHIEADSLRFLPDWQVRQPDDFRAIIDEKTQVERWVIDGNYSVTRDIVWPRGDTIIWLDYPLPITLWRLIRRTAKRIWTKEDLWGTGNRETLRKQLQFNEESLFYWFFKTYWRRKKDTPSLLEQYSHLHVLHFTHPRQTEHWLDGLSD
jgi:adenylate kinase family enzyme